MKRSTSRLATPIGDALAYTPVAQLQARLAATRAVMAPLQAAIEQLSSGFKPLEADAADLRDGVLTLNARFAAEAARLRQALPHLLRLLHQHGAQVTEIRVRVQPERMHDRETARTGSQGGTDAESLARSSRTREEVEAAHRFASELALTLPASPARDAAQTMATTLARRLSRMR